MMILRRAIGFILVLLVIPFMYAQDVSQNVLQEEAATELDIEELRKRIHDEAPQEFMSFSLGDSEVSLFLTGSWKGALQFSPGFFVSPVGFGYSAADTPLFTQEADLMLSLWINDRWFVEANFLDKSNQNTYRAGYQGFTGEFLQYAGIGNTGLDFPSFPYMDLGGDSTSSFGFYSRFGTNSLNIHALVRYDSASREERTFTGNRERTFSYIQPQYTVRGLSFVLPDTNIDSQITVYIEDEKGSARDAGGRRWRIATAGEFAASSVHGLVELSVRENSMIAVSYSTGANNRPWVYSMGSYDGTSEGFLTTVQDWFDPVRGEIRLENFPQPGGGANTTRPGEVYFGSVPALVIYEPGTFSPFERRNRYDAPSSVSQQADLVRLSTGAEISGFELVPFETSAATADILTFSAAVSQRGVYELLRTGAFSRRDPQTLWPLAREFPEIYLPSTGVFSGDITLRFTNFNSTSGYFIGTDVVSGSVQVWRSGIQDTNFSYNPSSGEVTIFSPVGQNEIVRVTYLKRSEETRTGSIAAGLGAIYNNDKAFSAEAAIGMRMNLSDSSYTEEDFSSAGNVGLSVRTSWDFDNLKARITGGFSLAQSDNTGLYRAIGMEGYETIITFQQENSFISHPFTLAAGERLLIENRADLVYRNYYNNTMLGAALMPIEWNAPVVTGLNRPYPARDARLGDTLVLTAEFALNSEERWTGFQIPLDGFSEIVSQAGEIEIPFRFYDFNGSTNNFKLIVQIGALSGQNFAVNENQQLVWEKTLFTVDSINSNTQIQEPRIARFTLEDEDRLRLGDAKFLRLIAVSENGEEISGRVLLAAPIVRGSSFRAITYDNANDIVSGSTDRVTAIETIDIGSTLQAAYPDIINRFHTSQATQRVLKIDWENMESGISAGVDTRVGQLPLSDYRELSFFVKLRNAESNIRNETLSFIVASGADSILNSYLEAIVPLSVFTEDQWSKVTIRYYGSNKGVFVDGNNIAQASFHYRPQSLSVDDSARRSSYIAVLINPENSSSSLNNGTIFIDEIILEDSVLLYRMNLGAGVEYSKPGALVSIAGFPVLADLSFSTGLETEARAGAETQNFSGSVAGRAAAEISLAGIKVAGNFSFTSAQDTFLWSADHDISRTIGIFSIKETFTASPARQTARHGLNLAITSDFFARFEADAFYDVSRLRQNWSFDTGYRPKNDYIPSLMIKGQALWTKNERIDENDNYGELWFKTLSPMIPDAGSGAATRRTSAQVVLTQRTTPVGAVITVDGSSFFSAANTNTQSENSLFLDIPVARNRTNLNFRLGRSFRRHLNFSGDDVFDDTRKFLESIEDFIPLWQVIPFYSFFAPELGDTMDKAITNSPSSLLYNYASFNDHFSVRINLPAIHNLSSFFIPSRMTFRLERLVEHNMDTRNDRLSIGGNLGFSSINMFGAMGFSPVFKFYHSDEYSHSIDAAVIIPREQQDMSWRVQSILGASYRGFSGGVLNFVNTLTLRSGGNWMESFTTEWEAPTKNSLLSVFYNWITVMIGTQSSWLNLSSLFNTNYEQLRRESLELVFDKSEDHLRWSVIAGHEEIIRILGRLNFTAFVKLQFSEDKNKEIFNFNALIGTTLRISF